ncbi:MAG TPA: hypothetical protein VFZ25_12665 [Chloroflexota bacterium]|nr:hypothetical protein [Chloroflexota bacterium]
MLEPIDYQRAVRDLQARRRRRKIQGAIRRVISMRPASASQIALIGLILVFAGWAVPLLHPLLLLGFVILVVGFVAGVVRMRLENAAATRNNPRPPGRRGRGDPPVPRPMA